MTSADLLQVFRNCGAVLEGHFQLSSGKHSDTYFEKFQVLQFPEQVELLCRNIADRFRDKNIEVVCGPTTGGILIAYEVARQLGVRAVYAEREDGKRVLRRGFEIERGERVLVVDDVLTTGLSVFEVLDMLKDHHANVMGVGIFVDRSGGNVDLGVPTESLLSMVVQAWAPDECPQCKAGEPITERGSRRLK